MATRGGLCSGDPGRPALTPQEAWGNLALSGRCRPLPGALGTAPALSLCGSAGLDAQGTAVRKRKWPTWRPPPGQASRRRGPGSPQGVGCTSICLRWLWPHRWAHMGVTDTGVADQEQGSQCFIRRLLAGRCSCPGGPLSGCITPRPSLPPRSENVPFLDALQLKPLACQGPAAAAAAEAGPRHGARHHQDPGQSLLPEQADFGLGLYGFGQAGGVAVQGLVHFCLHVQDGVPGGF